MEARGYSPPNGNSLNNFAVDGFKRDDCSSHAKANDIRPSTKELVVKGSELLLIAAI